MINSNSQRKMSDIIPPSKHRVESKKQTDIEKPKKQKSYFIPRVEKLFKNWKTIFAFFAILVVYGFVSFVFAKMKLELTPKFVSVAINEVVEFSKNPKNGELVFSEISFPSKKKAEFASTEKRTVSLFARGTITIKNDNKDPQVLVTNTRFESSSGKIYKTEKQIVIPKLGFLDVEIVANKPGPEYNEESLIDFTIPGFKEQNSPKFKTVYGKSKTKITGGFSGASLIVSESDVKNARSKTINLASLETKEDLVRKLPSESFLLAQSIRYIVSEEKIEPRQGSASEKFSLEISGAATGAIVNKNALEDFFARKINFYNSSYHVGIKNISEISFELLDFKPGAEKFKVKITGNSLFEAEVDEESMLKEIFKNEISKSSTIIAAFPALEEVKVSFRPFWLRLFPKNPERIDIKITSR